MRLFIISSLGSIVFFWSWVYFDMVEYFVFNTGVGTAEITLREKIRKLKPGSGHQEFHPGVFGLVNWG